MENSNHLKLFKFTGNEDRYFKIWLQNLLLTIFTLGIYSAWAKVKTLKFFYNHTELGDARFDFHATGLTIFKGRLFAVIALLLWASLNALSPTAGAILWVGFLLILPMVVVSALRFHLVNTSFNGVRFGFNGSKSRAWVVYALYPVLSALTLYTTFPLVLKKWKEFEINNINFGQNSFHIQAKTSDFYKVFLKYFLFILLGFVYFALISSFKPGVILSVFVLLGGVVVIFLYAFASFMANLQNLLLNNTTLAGNRFYCDAQGKELFKIYCKNAFLICLTLGIYTPYAIVAAYSYFTSKTGVYLNNQDIFSPTSAEKESSVSTGLADVMNIQVNI